jgi:hypothetical protein
MESQQRIHADVFIMQHGTCCLLMWHSRLMQRGAAAAAAAARTAVLTVQQDSGPAHGCWATAVAEFH